MRVARHNPVIATGVLIVHGLGGSGPEHWQTWLAGRLSRSGVPVRYPDLPNADAPALDEWCRVLEAELDAMPAPPVAVCHSLGAVLWLHLAVRLRRPLADRVLLVAPASAGSGVPEVAEFAPPPLDREAVVLAARVTRMVCAPSGDPYCPEGAGRLYGAPLGIPVDEIPDGAHLNPETGYGAWPAVEAWCLDERAAPVSGNGRRD